MKEAHHSRFTVHPGETKMYHDFEASILVAGYEAGYISIRFLVFNMSTSES